MKNTITLEKSRLNNISEMRVEIEFHETNSTYTINTSFDILEKDAQDYTIHLNDRRTKKGLDNLRKFLRNSSDEVMITIMTVGNSYNGINDLYRITTRWDGEISYRQFIQETTCYEIEHKDVIPTKTKITNEVIRVIKHIKSEIEKAQ